MRYHQKIGFLSAIVVLLFSGSIVEASASLDAVCTNNLWTPAGLQTDIVNSFAVAGKDTLYAGTDHGVFKTTDGGKNWTQMITGLSNLQVDALLDDPEDKGALYAGTDGGGVFKSSDGGKTWTQMITGLSNRSVAALLDDKGVLYAGTDGGGVFKSSDGGETWTQMITGLSNLFVPELAIDSKGTIYAGAGNTLFKSINSGANWTLTGLTNIAVSSLIVDNKDTIYVGSEFNPSVLDDGLHASSDGGANWWQEAAPEWSSYEVQALADGGDRVVVGTYGGGVGIVDKDTEMSTWDNSGLNNLYIQAVANDKNTIYVGTEAGVFKGNVKCVERFAKDLEQG